MRTKSIPSDSPFKDQGNPPGSLPSSQTLVGDSPTGAKSIMSEDSEKTPRPSQTRMCCGVIHKKISFDPVKKILVLGGEAEVLANPSVNTMISEGTEKTPTSSPTKDAAGDYEENHATKIRKHSHVNPSPAARKKIKKMPSLSKQQTLVTFIVDEGDRQQTFTVHKEFATFYCSDFEIAFNPRNGGIESETQVMKLPRTDATQFGKLVHWLYTKQIEVEDTTTGQDAIVLGLLDLLRLAALFEIGELHDTLMMNIIQHVKAQHGTDFSIIKLLARNVCGIRYDALLKKLVVEKLAWGTEPEHLAKLKEDIAREKWGREAWVQDLWSDVALAFSKHYWDGIPGKYFRVWGNVEDYMMVKKEVEKDTAE